MEMHLQHFICVGSQNISEIPSAEVQNADSSGACPAGHLHRVQTDAQGNYNAVLFRFKDELSKIKRPDSEKLVLRACNAKTSADC